MADQSVSPVRPQLAMSENAGEQETDSGSGRKRQRSITAAAANQLLSPPQHDVNNEPDITLPPSSRRRVGSSRDASCPGQPIFSFAPAFALPTTHSPSFLFSFDAPSSSGGVAATTGGTPRRFRIDLGSDAHRPREVNLAATDPMTGEPISTGPTSEDTPEACLVIWGMDINVQETKKGFKEFLEFFVDDQSEDNIHRSTDPNQLYYMAKSEEINALEEPFLDVNYDHITRLNLHSHLVRYPEGQDVVPTFDFASNTFAQTAGPSTAWL